MFIGVIFLTKMCRWMDICNKITYEVECQILSDFM